MNSRISNARSATIEAPQRETAEYKGEEYTLHHSITPDDFYRRIRVLDWDPLRAASRPYMPHGRRGASPWMTPPKTEPSE